MTFEFSPDSLKNREGIDPRLIEIDDLAIKLTLVDFGHGPVSGKRTAPVQNGLYIEGKSEADGYDKLSKHQLGKALDFYAYVNNKTSWQPDHLAMVALAYFQAASILGYKIKAGILWKTKTPEIKNGVPYGWDCPHIQLAEE